MSPDKGRLRCPRSSRTLGRSLSGATSLLVNDFSFRVRFDDLTKELAMLGGKDVAATIAVKDLAVARDFYENTLGLQRIEMEGMGDDAGAVLYRSGSAAVLVYESAYAGTNQATAASWAAGDDFDSIVESLSEKGVAFEHYDDLPGTTREGDVHLMGGLKAVWFKDPDGNILNVGNQSAEGVG
jgi:catechol 2,3-dioxygenase-like lactoylglutathione lyase family enzyme